MSMLECLWRRVQDCDVLGVYQRLPNAFGEYVIELTGRNEQGFCIGPYNIKIQAQNFYEKLLGLKEGRLERCVFAHGMADIDIFKRDGCFVIMHSPNEVTHIEFELPLHEFEKILWWLKPDI